MNLDAEILSDVSTDELEALAAGVLMPASQTRLDELLLSSKQHQLSLDEQAELDDVLHKVDQLNLLKARAATRSSSLEQRQRIGELAYCC